MADIQICFDYDGDESAIGDVLDAVAGAVRKAVDREPGFGVQVDGEHRDPDEPTSSLF